MGIEYPDAIDMFVPIENTFSTVTPISIVVHCTGGDMTIENIYNTFIGDGASTHFGIGRDGRVAQYAHLNRGAGGNCCADKDASGNYICDPYWIPYIQKYGNLNLCTISIEHCNDINNSLPLTDAQLKATEKLQLWLCKKYGITTDHIKGHDTICPRNRNRDPGAAYPWKTILQYINDEGIVSNTYQDQAIKDHFLSWFTMMHNVSKINLPATNTGIYTVYYNLYLNGVQLGPCTSYEYTSIDWSGKQITCQDFGSYRIEWVQRVGPKGIYGPTGSIPLP